MSCDTENISQQPLDKTKQELDLPEGVPPLGSLYAYISGSCNLACRHCWIAPAFQACQDGGEYIKIHHLQKAIHEAKPLGLHTVKLTGGEPTMHPQFREVVDLISSNGLSILIETNGTLLDSSLARFLRKTEHISFISVSLDGSDEKTHEALRGVKGCFKQAVQGIKNLVNEGFHPQLICTLHKNNISQIEGIIELAEGLGCGSVKFNLVQQIGRGESFAREYGLEVTDIIQLYNHIEDKFVPKYNIRIHFDIPFAFYPIRKLLKGSLSRCNVKNILGLLATGGLSLCGIGTTIPELIYGHVENDSLREVWCNSPGLVRLREQIPAHLEGICGQCLHRDFCLGTCIANNFHVAGRLNGPYQFCVRAEALGVFPASRKR